jgi:hypothetical protein
MGMGRKGRMGRMSETAGKFRLNDLLPIPLAERSLIEVDLCCCVAYCGINRLRTVAASMPCTITVSPPGRAACGGAGSRVMR